MPPNPFWEKPFKTEKQEPNGSCFLHTWCKCIRTVNGYGLENVYEIPVIHGKVGTISEMTAFVSFRLADTCLLTVDKTVETVNNILYIHRIPKIR